MAARPWPRKPYTAAQVDVIAATKAATATTITAAAGGGLTGGGDLSANRTLSADFGSAAGKICQGNDARLSDARTPTAHASSHASGGGDPVTLAQSQITNLTNDLAAKQATSEKNAASGYAGLSAASRITKGADAADDLIIDSTSRGLVLKDTDGHYWRLSVSTLGVLTAADLGTNKPGGL